MSWLFSQVLVAEYSADTCSDGAPSAPSSGTPMPQAYLWRDKTTDAWRPFRFGMTFKPLTDDLGMGLLTWYLGAFHAKTFQPLAVAQASQERAAACGNTWQGLLAKYDPVSCTWKTAQCSLLEDLEQSLETWPRWGSMRNGACYQRRELVRHTSESVFGFSLPTPVASDATSGAVIGKNDTYYTTSTGVPRKVNQKGTDGSIGLGRLVQMWPTPTVHGNNNRKGLSAKSGDGLATAVKMWTTPSASDAKRGGRITENMTGTSLAQQVNTPTTNIAEGTHGGQLNPTWVEWLMGWPLGWSELKPLEMDKFQQWQRQHGASLGVADET